MGVVPVPDTAAVVNRGISPSGDVIGIVTGGSSTTAAAADFARWRAASRIGVAGAGADGIGAEETIAGAGWLGSGGSGTEPFPGTATGWGPGGGAVAAGGGTGADAAGGGEAGGSATSGIREIESRWQPIAKGSARMRRFPANIDRLRRVRRSYGIGRPLI